MYCPDSKVMHDDVIKSCFMEAYFLLTKDRGLVIDNFINSLKDSARDTEPVKMKLKIENEIKIWYSIYALQVVVRVGDCCQQFNQ